MKNFKKVFSIIFAVFTIAFGVLMMIEEKAIVMELGHLNFDATHWKVSLVVLIYVLVDIFLILLPLVGLILVLFNKFDPYKVMVGCALTVLAKFLFVIFFEVCILAIGNASAADWKAYFFGDTLAILPTIVFTVAIVLILISSANQFDETVARAIVITIGSSLAIFGLVFYFVLGVMGPNPSWLVKVGLSLCIACFAGLVVYSYLPQARESEEEEE